MILHEGHHHHYYKNGTHGAKRTYDVHWHEPSQGLAHKGNAIYGGPCICPHNVWQDAKDAQWGLVDAWDDLKATASDLYTKVLRALFTIKK